MITSQEVTGDLYAVVNVAIPESVTQEQAEWLEKGRELGLFGE